jgi:hypothetical protein
MKKGNTMRKHLIQNGEKLGRELPTRLEQLSGVYN